jgi:carbon monoxide dehydrogenase subunit G
MELQGTHQFKAPISTVWDALLDPTVLSKALPGGDQLERVGENDYKAAMNVKVGPVQGRFEGQVTLSDIVQHKSYRMKVSGTGAPGFLNGEGSLSLQENDQGTLLTYAGDVQIGGRIASVGQRLIDSTAKSIIRQGLKTLDEQMLGGGEKGGASEETPKAAPKRKAVTITTEQPAESAAETPSQPEKQPEVQPRPEAAQPKPSVSEPSPAAMTRMAVDVAKDVAQDLASDYIPREKQPQVFAFCLGALAMLAFVLLVRAVQRD